MRAISNAAPLQEACKTASSIIFKVDAIFPACPKTAECACVRDASERALYELRFFVVYTFAVLLLTLVIVLPLKRKAARPFRASDATPTTETID